jgi:phosphoenolpyruvate carboxylase
MFSRYCEQGFTLKQNPQEIVFQFFEKHFPEMNEKERNNVLFQLIQYVERQIVLFDAIEDAAFGVVNNMEGRGSIRNLKEKAEQKGKQAELIQFLKDFQLRLVLTAHPTQFYPGPVLGIITDLTDAIQQNDLVRVKDLLAQLGKTPFIKKQKPAPIEEAISLIWYLENVFYDTVGKMLQYIQTNIDPSFTIQSPVVQIGFWPGGDREGNPFVTHETSRETANQLSTSVLKCYYQDIRKLKRKLTFKDVDTLVAEIEQQLYRSVFYSKGELYITYEELLEKLLQIRSLLVQNHQGLYLSEVDNLLLKVQTFGFHFAILDIRQNAKIQENVFAEIVEKEALIGVGITGVMSNAKILLNAEILQEKQEIAAVLEWRRISNPLAYHKPMDMQRRFQADQGNFKIVFGGNRAGKTEAVAPIVLNECLQKPKQKWWVCGETYQDSIAIQQNKRWCFLEQNTF